MDRDYDKKLMDDVIQDIALELCASRKRGAFSAPPTLIFTGYAKDSLEGRYFQENLPLALNAAGIDLERDLTRIVYSPILNGELKDAKVSYVVGLDGLLRMAYETKSRIGANRKEF